MIDIPYETIISKLKETGLTEEEISSRIKKKLDQLSGLISKEGAAHILANELNVKLVETTSGRMKIQNIMMGMRNVDVVGKVTNKFQITEFTRKDGVPSKVGSFILADETGRIKITCWGEQADKLSSFNEQDVVKVVGVYIRENQGRKEIHVNDNSKIIVNPQGESIGDISFESRDFQRKKVSDLVADMNNVEVLGTIVSVEALRFFEVCPECRKRARVKREEFECDTHGVIIPDYNYVMNIIIDDGSGNIRAVLFENMVESALEMDKSKLLEIKDSPEGLDQRNKLLGSIVKIKGRIKKNTMFDRLEFSVQDIDLKPDPHEEMVELDAEIEEVKKDKDFSSIEEL
jgi:replication factor A1